MSSQILTFVFRNNWMGYTVLILDTDVKEGEVIKVTKKDNWCSTKESYMKKQPTWRVSTLDEVTNVKRLLLTLKKQIPLLLNLKKNLVLLTLLRQQKA